MPRNTDMRVTLALFCAGLCAGGVPRVHAERGSVQRHGTALALIETRFEDADETDDEPEHTHAAKRASRSHEREPRSEREERSAPLEHKVVPGETLSGIAKHYGVSVQQILELNPSLNPDRIRDGNTLVVGGERHSLLYTVKHGDTLSSIAKTHDVSLLELQRWNPKLDPDHIREGQELFIYPKKPRSLSESVGTPASGQLVNARPLPPGPGYRVRTPERSWGTDETVRGIVSAFEHFAKVDPKAPALEVHDLSLRHGGRMNEHRSHQSGRDVDIAYPQRQCSGVCGFHKLAASELDVARTFALLKYWLERDMLEAVFMDYRLQAALYAYARSKGASQEELHRWFQYPNGPGNPWGVVRHYPKHDDHMHVRFACDTSDPECRTYRPLFMRTASR